MSSKYKRLEIQVSCGVTFQLLSEQADERWRPCSWFMSVPTTFCEGFCQEWLLGSTEAPTQPGILVFSYGLTDSF